MQWTPGDRSNVEDARGRSVSMAGIGSFGIGGVLLLALLSWATGVNFLDVLNPSSSSTGRAIGSAPPASTSPAEEREVDFVDAVMKDVQATWQTILPRYRSTRAVIFRDAIDSACGMAQSATGPFYCPQDGRVYLDLGFFQDLSDRFGAPGDFARAYVIAHEVGHHVQRLSGIEARTREDSVPLELQADCFAGVWGNVASRKGQFQAGRIELDPGDAEEALAAAAAIGDDRLQRMTTGRVMPERFTHGSSAQRVEWFRRGLTTGRPEACDTFHSNPAVAP